MTDTPIYIDPLVGWRTWHLETDRDALHPDPWAVSVPAEVPNRQGPGGDGQFRLFSRSEWPPRERLVARCHFTAYAMSPRTPTPEDHRAPEPKCSCGIYAARSHRILRDRGYAAGPDDHHAPDVVGEVWMWGRVMESSEILRAEFAYPKRVYVPHLHWRWAAPLREIYGVPVEVKNPFTMEVT